MATVRALGLGLLGMAIVACLSGQADAGTRTWVGAGTGGNTATDPSDPTTWWDNPDNWEGGLLPGPGDSALLPFTDAGWAYASAATVNELRISGPSADGALVIGPSGDFAAAYDVLGYSAGGFGTIVQTGGTYTVATRYVGCGGQGVHIQSGGTVLVSESMLLGLGAGSLGRYELSGGTLRMGTPDVLGTEYIGATGGGEFIQSGGVHEVYGDEIIGWQKGSSGKYVLSGGTHIVNGALRLGYSGLVQEATYEMSGGTLFAQEMTFAGRGRFLQSGGTCTVDAGLEITGTYRLSGTGVLNTGGTVSVPYGRLEVFAPGIHAPAIVYGRWGTLAMGFDFDVDSLFDGSLLNGTGVVCKYGRGWLEVTNGATARHLTGSLVQPGNVRIGSAAGSGRYILGGSSTLTVETASIGAPGGATFEQSGGVLTATRWVEVGSGPGQPGTYYLTGGLVMGDVLLANEGTFNQAGGTVYGGVVVGNGGTGTFILSDGLLQSGVSVGYYPAGRGTLVQTGGTLQGAVYVGQQGSGVFTLAGGTVTGPVYLGNQGGSGTLLQSGGTLSATSLYVGSDGIGSMSILAPAATVRVSNTLLLGSAGSLSAVPGSAIRMVGAALDNQSADPGALAGLSNLALVYEGGPGDVDPFEVAGRDLGPVLQGFRGNFETGALSLGYWPPGSAIGQVRLVDGHDNQPAWAGAEALYVGTLQVRAGSYLDLNGLNLYYLAGAIDPGAVIVGGWPVRVPAWWGDVDLDGDVDFADYQTLEANFGLAPWAAWGAGDFDGDGDVDFADFQLLEANYGAAIPEPGAAMLLVLGGVCATVRARRAGRMGRAVRRRRAKARARVATEALR